MRKLVILIGLFLLLASCKEGKKEVTIEQGAVMYESSEMAIMMRRLYEFNKATKALIINKDSLLPYPEEFLTIHTAVLTDSTERGGNFDSIAQQFLMYQKATYVSNRDSTAYNFNQSIHACVSCHQTRCEGPIPKIKKLLIQ